MYIAPGQGQTNSWGQNFYVNRKALSFWPFVASFFFLNYFEVWFYTYFLMFSCMYLAPGQEQSTPWWQFWCQQKAKITLTICCKFQKDLFEFWFYTHFLIISYMYIALRLKGRQTLENKLLISTESSFLFDHLLQVSKKPLWILILYTFFNVFPHVYSPKAGADNPLWTKFWCQQEGLATLPICCKFQTNIFEVWFYTYFCLFLYMYIAPGQGQTTPWGQNLYFNINLLSLWSFAVSFFH